MSNLEGISGRLQKRLLFVTIAIGFLIFIFLSIPVIMDNNSVQKALCSFMVKQLRESLDSKPKTFETILVKGLTPDRVKISLFPLPTVELQDIKITTPPLENCTIQKIVISFSPESFSKKQILINNITFQNPVIPSSISLLSLPFTQQNNIFNYLAKEQKKFSIDINNLKSDIFRIADIKVLIAPVNNSINADITIYDITIPNLISINDASKIIPNTIEKNINFEKTVTVEKKSKANRYIKEKDIKIDKLLCTIAITKNQSTIEIKNIAILPFSPDLCVQFKYHKEQAADSSSEVFQNSELIFSGKDISVDNVKADFLKFLPNNLITEKIFQILCGGIVRDIEVIFKNSIKNSLESNLSREKVLSLFSKESIEEFFNPRTMIIKGEIKDGTINIPATNLTATETDATVIVKDGILSTNIKKGVIDKSNVNSGTLDVNLVSKKHIFSGEFDILADLAHLKSVLIDLLPSSYLSKELALLNNIKGEAEGTLKLEGEKGYKPSVIITTSNINLSGTYDRLPDSFSISDGNFNYNSKLQLAALNNLKVKVGSSYLSDFAASLVFDKSYLLKIVSGRADIELEQMFPWFTTSLKVGSSSILPLIKYSKGKIYIKEIAFKGEINKPETWDYLVEGNCNAVGLGQEIFDIKAYFLISPSLTRISLDNATVQDTSLISALINQLMKSESIQKEMFDRISVVSDIKTPFSIKDAYFEQEGALRGKLIFNNNLSIFFNRDTISDEAFEYQIKILKNGVESATVLFKEKTFIAKNSLKDSSSIDFTGSLNTKDIEAVLNPLSESYKLLETFTDRREITIESLQPYNYTVTIDRLDLDFILEKQKLITMSLSSILKSDASKRESSPIVLTVNSDEFTDKNIIIVPFSAKIVINGQDRNITIDNMQMCNVDGAIEVNITKDFTYFFLTLHDSSKNIEPVIGCFYRGDRFMQGNYSLKASLYAQGKATIEIGNTAKDSNSKDNEVADINIQNLKSIIKENLEGKVEMVSDGGRIFRLTLLSRILSMLNISKLMEGTLPDIEQNGFAYTSITIVADVKKSRLILNRAVINGVDMTLLFTGWIDIFTRQIELTCLVAPLKTADRIISKVPILNTMLRGRLISVPVKATGTLTNPEVRLINPSEMGKGVINTMLDILTTPFKLFNTLQSE